MNKYVRIHILCIHFCAYILILVHYDVVQNVDVVYSCLVSATCIFYIYSILCYRLIGRFHSFAIIINEAKRLFDCPGISMFLVYNLLIVLFCTILHRKLLLFQFRLFFNLNLLIISQTGKAVKYTLKKQPTNRQTNYPRGHGKPHQYLRKYKTSEYKHPKGSRAKDIEILRGRQPKNTIPSLPTMFKSFRTSVYTVQHLELSLRSSFLDSTLRGLSYADTLMLHIYEYSINTCLKGCYVINPSAESIHFECV